MPEATIRAKIDVAFDVERNLAPQITFHLEAVNQPPQLHEIVVGEIVGLDVEVDIRVTLNLARRAPADAENVRERDFHSLRLRKIDACNTCHDLSPLALPLLVARVGAEDSHDALTPYDLALLANLFDRCAHFHFPAPSFTWSGW